MFGSETRIIDEFQVGESLRLDFYLPDYKLGIEYHGRQHKEFVEHFHKTIAGFKDSQRRDRRKFELASGLGIPIAVFWDDEVVDSDLLKERIKEAIAEQNVLLKEVLPNLKKEAASEYRSEQRQKYKESKAYEEQLDRAREARKERYQYDKRRREKV